MRELRLMDFWEEKPNLFMMREMVDSEGIAERWEVQNWIKVRAETALCEDRRKQANPTSSDDSSSLSSGDAPRLSS